MNNVSSKSFARSAGGGEVILGDRNFGTFANLVLLKRQGADGVFRRHQARGAGVKASSALGQDD